MASAAGFDLVGFGAAFFAVAVADGAVAAVDPSAAVAVAAAPLTTSPQPLCG